MLLIQFVKAPGGLKKNGFKVYLCIYLVTSRCGFIQLMLYHTTFKKQTLFYSNHLNIIRYSLPTLL